MDTQLRTIQKKRTANFREDETKLLIQLWGSPSIQNKLFLTHRKAPVMRLLAANMQQRGFYRTPDEIKTRIRNLKCLYHRIKRSMACGTGIGTVDPDWPHFKAMDDILSKEYPRKDTGKLMEEILDEGPRPEEVHIKQEIDEIDIDDNDSWATNESLNSEYEDDGATTPTPPTTTTTQKPTTTMPTLTAKKMSTLQQQQPMQTQQQHILNMQNQHKKLPTILPAISLPNAQVQNQNSVQGGKPNSIPFPLLILNNLQPQQQQNGEKGIGVTVNQPLNVGQMKKDNAQQKTIPLHFSFNPVLPQNTNFNNNNYNLRAAADDLKLSNLLKELVEVQKSSLDIQKEKLEIEKQRLEFDRLIGTQLVTLIPMLGGVLQKLSCSNAHELSDIKLDGGLGKKRKKVDDDDDDEPDLFKESKILRTMLEQGIKKYMNFEDDKESKDSDNEDDSGIHNDEQSNSSEKSSEK